MGRLAGGKGFGLYFDDAKVYAVELHKEFGELQISRSAEADVPQSTEITIMPSASFVAAARRMLEKAKITARHVSVAIPEKEVMVRYFEVPLVPKKEWAGVVRFEAQKYVPFDIRELYFDYDLFVDRLHKKIGVAFVAAKKTAIDELIDVLRVQGFVPTAIETASIALVRTLQLPDAKDVRALVYRDGEGATTVVIFKQRSVMMSRTGVPMRDPLAQEATRPRADLFVSEIRLAFNYFSKNFKNEVIKQIFVCAEPAEGEEWVALLGREFSLPTQSAAAVSAFGRGRSLSPGMTVAAGLALRDVRSDGGKKISLLPKEKPKSKTSEAAPPLTPEEEGVYLKKWAVRELVAAAVLLIATYFFFSSRVAEERKVFASSRLIPLKSATANTGMKKEDLRERLSALETREGFLRNFIEGRPSVTTKLNEISKTIPDELQLSEIDYNTAENKTGVSNVSMRLEGLIVPRGSGNELSLANNFVNALKNNATFKERIGEIKLTAVKKTVGSVPGYFSIDCSPPETKPDARP